MDENERFIDLEVKLAYQEKLIRELDALVRTFGDRLDVALREIDQLKKGVAQSAPAAVNQKPPHY